MDGQLNALRCQRPNVDTTAPYAKATFSFGDTTSSGQRAGLSSHTTDLLMVPPDPTDASAAPRVLTAMEPDEGSAYLQWNGTQVLIATTDGSDIAVSPSDGCQRGAPIPAGLSGTVYQVSGSGPITPQPLYSGSAVMCAPVTGGTIVLTIAPPQTVDIPGTATLSAGAAVRFRRPEQPRPPGSPPPTYSFGPVLLVNGSDQSLELNYDGRTLGIAAPAGLSIELIAPFPAASFQDCVAVDGQPNIAGCQVSQLPFIQNNLFITTVPSRNTFSNVAVPANGSVALLGQPSFTLVNGTNQTAGATWDGAVLTITLPEGTYIVAGPAPFTGDHQLSDASCVIDEHSPNQLDCMPAPGPESAIRFTWYLPAPEGSISVPFTDNAGAGTLTLTNVGPDTALGGSLVSAALTQGGATLVGSGALRPQPNSSDFSLFLSLDDGLGGERLVEGRLAEAATGWTGSGPEESLAGQGWSDTWSTGDQRTSSPTGEFVNINIAPPPGGGPTFPPLPAIRATPSGDISLRIAQPAFWGPPDASSSAEWRWGDGQETSTGIDEVVNHTYSASGDYTVLAIVTDAEGVRSFGTANIIVP